MPTNVSSQLYIIASAGATGEALVEEINKLICEKQVFYDYRVIKNANITREHIWRDKIHLNESGLSLLANNFIQAINRKHTA